MFWTIFPGRVQGRLATVDEKNGAGRQNNETFACDWISQVAVVKREKKCKNLKAQSGRTWASATYLCVLIGNLFFPILCSPDLSPSMCLFESLQGFQH